MAEEAQLLKGILEGCVLGLLSREATYGYRVVEMLRDKGFAGIQEATVYPLLTRLNKKGTLAYVREPSEIGPPRKVYSLTAEGKRELAHFQKSWFAIRENVDQIMKEAAV